MIKNLLKYTCVLLILILGYIILGMVSPFFPPFLRDAIISFGDLLLNDNTRWAPSKPVFYYLDANKDLKQTNLNASEQRLLAPGPFESGFQLSPNQESIVLARRDNKWVDRKVLLLKTENSKETVIIPYRKANRWDDTLINFSSIFLRCLSLAKFSRYEFKFYN